ncbi:UvrD-helicase domain-containing protein [Variovorax sp. J22R24]|uniref:UvrD-helicase domain-containing protein n=1 Tax=Variovorax gracilis TaxID=3053502 RepID=UPI002575E6B8|nr:UvrD-helicase domain-containing protein [Variovorax sp. J22R24]MDM0106524.1 UvrD-helicase domain-containing protein [Variovorax sp. J22R24]
MTTTWKPSTLGKLLTRAPDWTLELDGERLRLTIRGETTHFDIGQLERLSVKPGLIWGTLIIPLGDADKLALDGISNHDAKQCKRAIGEALAAKRQCDQIVGWVGTTLEAFKRQIARRGWLGREFAQRLEASKPSFPTSIADSTAGRHHLSRQPQSVQDAVRTWQRRFEEFVTEVNERHAAQVAEMDRSFFDRVEKSPLTAEQRKAVMCFDNRMLLVASAGSGKTSTMVAKAGYALRHGYFSPERILLLAFNTDAAAELRERVRARLGPLGLPADLVVAKTFHAFGLDVIGAAAGRKPSLAPWLESGEDLATLVGLIDDLKDRDPEFRVQWDLYRIVLWQDLPKFGKEEENPNAWSSESRRDGFWTLNGEVVRSQGEVVLANWLFYNGIRYVYEGDYEHDTADANYRQYRPDFYLPDAKAYLEHWALDENGDPPKAFASYRESMAWKRALHQQHGTILLETTMAQLWSGEAFEYLSRELPKLGVNLDPNPDRAVPGRQPVENPRLAVTFRTFLTHVKSSRLSMQDLRERLQQRIAGDFQFRHGMFLRLFEKILGAWTDKLRSGGCIDFEDMLNMATDCVESGQWTSPYELVMVDEFQDASRARARMAAALVHGEDKYLFAVGDDWQAINRFAGADLGVMTEFESLFGKGVTLKLETTFRCPPSLCGISSKFVLKNPRQIAKEVRSPIPDITEPVRIIRVEDERFIRGAIERRLQEISKESAASGSKVKVLLLGRYRKDQVYMPDSYDRRWVEPSFLTVHSSKGLEADHVIIPRVTSETLGFPSKVADDPVLQLAMPTGDGFEYAEERRLFYVALTRARSTATLITVRHMESAFVTELLKGQGLRILNADGSEADSELCPKCGNGFLRLKKSKYGPFMGCSTFPRCSYTRDARRLSG